jgi:hypothetical protein
VAVFLAISVYLFSKTEYAPWVMVAAALGIAAKFGGKERNDFLKSCFPRRDFFLIRLLENVVATLPFIAVLAWQADFPMILPIVAGAVVMAFYPLRVSTNITIPTPFFKQPFEFITGFRTSWLLVLLAWFLTAMGIVHDNFNLGIFALISLFVLAVTFYPNPEEPYYLWIFNTTPGGFLFRKMKAATFHSTILHIPVTVTLILFYPGKTGIVALVILLAWLILMTVILAKYARFPRQINLIDVFILAMAIWFPLILLAAVPWYISKSKRNLRQLFA